jgi:putative tryptophan/tyrosine transport system substrate-binding protein
MRRREFIAGLGSVVAWPLAARAQQGERVRRIGVLTFATEGEEIQRGVPRAFREGLRKLGWIEGRNLQIDFRFGGGDPTRTRVFNS